jgi:hypothetical protein
MFVTRDPDGSEHGAPSYLSALQLAIGWARAIGAPVDVCSPAGDYVRTVQPTDTISSIRSERCL